jgi:hypothetical protein
MKEQGASTEEDLVFNETVLIDRRDAEVQVDCAPANLSPTPGSHIRNPVSFDGLLSAVDEPALDIDKHLVDDGTAHSLQPLPPGSNSAISVPISPDFPDVPLSPQAGASDTNESHKKDVVEVESNYKSPLHVDFPNQKAFKFTLPSIKRIPKPSSEPHSGAFGFNKHAPSGIWTRALSAIRIQVQWRKYKRSQKLHFARLVHELFDNYLTQSAKKSAVSDRK